MNKVKLTIIKDNPAATINPHTEVVQEVNFGAAECAAAFRQTSETVLFQFGNAVIYTHGVQAFIFEDVE